MKIAVSGAHRVGKTTLVEKLQEALPGYEIKAEAYYELEERGLGFSETPTVEDFAVLLEQTIEQIITSDGDVIFDRCPIDILAYIQAVSESGNFDIQSLYQRVQDVMSEVDLVVFVPIEKRDLIDCHESDLPELRNKVNEILNEWIGDFDLNTVKVFGSTSERRVEVIRHMTKIS